MTVSLIVRRTIRASPDVLFAAWTRPELLVQWWGPKGVTCTFAEVEARTGGRLRIANELPDGTTVWIEGEFIDVVRDELLVYTWRTDRGSAVPERVTVRFEARGEETEVIVVHEQIADEETKSGHALGWEGCLDALARFAAD